MEVAELNQVLAISSTRLAQEVLSGHYRAQPILGVEIPKANGKKRLLGIPTVTDRLLQQAVLQVIQVQFEVEFLPNSYGFRPGKSLHQAVQKAQEYIHEGYSHIVDIDLKSFFDEVNHCYLLELLYRKIKCRHTLCLIRKWLRAPIQVKGKLVKRRKGIPQGSPLSPLLGNIMLHELDRELKRQGQRFVRYADDFSIYAKTKTAARNIGNTVYKFLKDKLKLPINREKSALRKPVTFRLLGFGFVPTYGKGDRGRYQLVVTEKGWKSFKAKLKTLTRKTTPMSLAERIARLNEVIRGWVTHYRMANIYAKLQKVEGWVRNRLRYCIWHHWKKPERKRKNLIRLGISPDQAYAWSRTRMGGWAVAQSPILNTTITVNRLKKRGYLSALELYSKLAPQRNEPLYTRPVRTVV
jgi:group II intron reverse transcriptase/maturase